MSNPQSVQGRRQNIVAGLVWQSAPAIWALFGISMVSNLLMLTGPMFMLQVYDRVLASRSLPTLVALSLLVGALYAFYALIELVRSRMAIRFGGVIEDDLSKRLFETSIRQKLAATGRTSVDPVRDLDSFKQFVSGPGPISLFDLPWIPVYLAVVFLLHPLLGWLSIAGAAVITVLLTINEVVLQRPSQEIAQAAVLRQMQSDDARANAETIMAMGMLAPVATRWQEASRVLSGKQGHAADWGAFYSSTTKAFRFLLQSAVLGVGAYLTIRQEITGGVMIAASIVSSRALAPVEQVVGQWRGFVTARQALGRINQLLQRQVEERRQVDLPKPKSALAVKSLATGPGPQQKPLVAGVTFDLEAGQGMGVIGPSGSGKTSVIRSLVGIWPVLQGEVRLDGAELRHYAPERLGRSIGYLPQSVDLFDGTVAQNIARFDPEANSDDILKAASLANAHDLISSFPEGYETRIGERGAALSAGQRQRLALARAMYGDPFLLVLDEPNSNLDADGEAALNAALLAARKRGAIVIVVAHRPSALAAMDMVLVLKDGRQAAFGPKEEVLAKITQPAQVVTPAFGGVRTHG